MWTQALIVVSTSLLTSVLTLGLAWLLFDRYLKARIRAEVEVTAEQLGSRFKQQVSEGVREGIGNGLSDLRKKAAKSAARGGFDLIEENLNLWLRGGRSED